MAILGKANVVASIKLPEGAPEPTPPVEPKMAIITGLGTNAAGNEIAVQIWDDEIPAFLSMTELERIAWIGGLPEYRYGEMTRDGHRSAPITLPL